MPPREQKRVINIVVIGASGVGKSTFIQKAFGLRTPPESEITSQNVLIDKLIYAVNLIELHLESFDVHADRRIKWPKQVEGQLMPRIDGALTLYDVLNEESITAIPEVLSEHSRANSQ